MMVQLRVQIYEIQEPEEAEALLDLGVHCIGSVLVSAEDWKIPAIRKVIDCVKRRSGQSSLIPLFSEQDQIFRAIDWYQPDVIHLCENLTITQGDILGDLIRLQEAVKKNYPNLKIMRSIPIGETGKANRVPTLDLARRFEPVSDLFLTDTLIVSQGGTDKEQPVHGFVGITGQTCDWGMARKLVEQSRLPVILAGGLSPGNVFEAAVTTLPAGVDSCTQTNQVDQTGKPIRFKKDLEKVKTFVKEALRAEMTMLKKQDTLKK
ncbi:MAG: hypothetical protein KKD44_09990 [Proteobacteria bacterium]|nr:hypothetical protein [Pseudomonadota bacterium]